MVNVVGTVNVSEAARDASRRIGLAYASSAATLATAPLFLGGLVSDTLPLQPEVQLRVHKVANEATKHPEAELNS